MSNFMSYENAQSVLGEFAEAIKSGGGGGTSGWDLTHKIIYIPRAGTYTVTFPTSPEATTSATAGMCCYGEIHGVCSRGSSASFSSDSTFSSVFTGSSGSTSNPSATGLAGGTSITISVKGFYSTGINTGETGKLTIRRNLRTFTITAENGNNGYISSYPIVMEIYAIFP